MKTQRLAYRWTRRAADYNMTCVECKDAILGAHFQKEYKTVKKLKEDERWGVVKGQTLCFQCYRDLYGPDKPN